MPDVERKIAPRVRRRGGDRAAPVKTELQQTDDAATTSTQRRKQLLWFNLVSIDRSRHRDTKFLSQRLDPHTPRIVNVAGYHPNGPPRGARHFRFPKFLGQVLNEEDGDAVVGVPRGKQRFS